MSSFVPFQTDKAPAAVGPYSQSVWDPSTKLLFCSGQLGLDPATGEMVSGGAVEEFRQIVKNIEAVLGSAGCAFKDVIKVTVFLTDMADFAPVNQVYAEAFTEPFPARSAFQVSALPKGGRIEVEVVAVRSS